MVLSLTKTRQFVHLLMVHSQWTSGINVNAPSVQEITCNDTSHNYWRTLDSSDKFSVSQPENSSFVWNPELSPFLIPHLYLLVIIALTLNVREINQNAFFKVNGCKESKRRGKIGMLSQSPLCMKAKDKPKCKELVSWFTPAAAKSRRPKTEPWVGEAVPSVFTICCIIVTESLH